MVTRAIRNLPVMAGAIFIAGATNLSMSTASDLHDSSVPPTVDQRAVSPVQTLNTPRVFPAYKSLAEWKARKKFIREQILVSCGLYPLPRRTPLNARVFDKLVRDGYTIEKVCFETYPGFYLAGNLYRPLEESASSKKHPGILVTHGHWPEGRMADTPNGSIPARAISFARQGCVAFTYDMVGYNDTRQLTHGFAGDREHWLWGVSLMGLQTWNSIRSLDFLSALPDVDSSRLAITGESGGGTQTMILGAIDDRLAAVGPCVMVSHIMQGGCLCENAPGLRIEFSNMEVAAAAAPKFQIMVGATGDWTKTMLTIEGPSVQHIYDLYGRPNYLKYAIFPFPHNINKTSREAVYEAFGAWLLGDPNPDHFREADYKMEPVEALRVFPDGAPLPPNAKSEEGLTAYIEQHGQAEIERRKPKDVQGLASFRKTYLPVWEHTVQAETPSSADLIHSPVDVVQGPGYIYQRFTIGRDGRGDSIRCALLTPRSGHADSVVLVAHPNGIAGLIDPCTGAPGPLPAAILGNGQAVLLMDVFQTEASSSPGQAQESRSFGTYYTTYNRTTLQQRIQDLVTASTYCRAEQSFKHVLLAGVGQAGLWTLLAAPTADGVAADCNETDTTNDSALLTDDLYIPCLRKMGDFRTTALLGAPHPLLMYNTGGKFPAAQWVSSAYQALGLGGSCASIPGQETVASLAAWLHRASQQLSFPARYNLAPPETTSK